MLSGMKNKPRYHILLVTYAAIICSFWLSSCAGGKTLSYKLKKIDANALRSDFDLMQQVFEREHPSLYWYTPKEKMDSVFQYYRSRIKDSMTEIQFRTLVSQTVNQLRCGHTSVRSSKSYEKYIATARLSLFPFGMRLWDDTMAVSYNLWRKDTLLKRGTRVTAINGIPATRIRDSIFETITTDGYADNFKNIRVSNNFPYYHSLLFDSSRKYEIRYIDSLGNEQPLTVGIYRSPPRDTTRRRVTPPPGVVRPSRRELKLLRRLSIRRLRIDTIASTAYMDLNSFSGGKLKKFFRKSFRTIDKLGIQNLVIDLRSNGGGLIGNSIALSKYITNNRFKIADTVFTNHRFSKYNRHIRNRFWYGLGMLFVTRKRADGNYHFGWWERHYYKPRKKNHFDGKLYCITGGYSFSATTLFLNVVKGQNNVLLVGEETGGSAYGNSAVFLSDITLPYSKLRVRLPMFRLVMDTDQPQNGRGIQPDILIKPTLQSVREQRDLKMEWIRNKIKGG
jgi:hypothetical protein